MRKRKLQKGSYWKDGLFHFVADTPVQMPIQQPAISPDGPQLTPNQNSSLTFEDTPNTPNTSYLPDDQKAFEDSYAKILAGKMAMQAKGLSTNPFKSTGNEGNDSNPMNRGPVDTGPEKTPEKPKYNPFLLMRGVSTAASFLSNAVARKAQNNYDYSQQTALGQMNPIPVDQFQPTYNNMYAQQGGMMNPFSIYARYGGNLKSIIKDYHRFSNNAQMDMGDGKVDDQGMMERGGYNIPDEYTHDLIKDLLNMGRFHENYKKGTKPTVYKAKAPHKGEMKKGGHHMMHGKHMMPKKHMDMDMDECPTCKDNDMDEMAKGGNWLRGAVNPDHKGWCTPLSNPHCTGHRRAFALMMKKNHGFHEAQMGGIAGQQAWKAYNDQLSQNAIDNAPKPSYNFSALLNKPNADDSLYYDIAFDAMAKKEPYALNRFAKYEAYGVPKIGPGGNDQNWNTDMNIYNRDMSAYNAYKDAIEQMNKPNPSILLPKRPMSMRPKKKGGLTPNKAREILHDGTAQGHLLTDKQRRFFGAMSKGNTMNYRGHK